MQLLPRILQAENAFDALLVGYSEFFKHKSYMGED
jgi:hypothetical protein